MPRSRRPSRRGGQRGRPDADDELDLGRLLLGARRTEVKRSGTFSVQPSGGQGEKSYVCPACPQPIEPGVAHVVVWRADGIFGEERDIEGRRHWHTHCWRMEP